jgi:hypothetical protein
MCTTRMIVIESSFLLYIIATVARVATINTQQHKNPCPCHGLQGKHHAPLWSCSLQGHEFAVRMRVWQNRRGSRGGDGSSYHCGLSWRRSGSGGGQFADVHVCSIQVVVLWAVSNHMALGAAPEAPSFSAVLLVASTSMGMMPELLLHWVVLECCPVWKELWSCDIWFPQNQLSPTFSISLTWLTSFQAASIQPAVMCQWHVSPDLSRF